MILIVPGVNSYTPIKESLNGCIYHLCDILRNNPVESYNFNKILVKNTFKLLNPTIIIGKSYGAWIVAESIKSQKNKFLFSLPLKDEKTKFGFPKFLDKNNSIIIGNKDKNWDENTYDLNKDKIKSLWKFSGDHSLKPITLKKISKINKILFNETSKQEYDEKYIRKRVRAKISIKKESTNYKRVSDNLVKKFISNRYNSLYGSKSGPVTDIVKRNSPFERVFLFQSNIVDTSKINKYVKDCPATGGFGVSISEEVAMSKCFFEALERYSLTLGFIDCLKLKYDEIPNNIKLNEKYFSFYKKNKMKKYNMINAIKEKIDWTVIREVATEKELLYPFQLIVPNDIGYRIRETTSSGSALGTSKEIAIYNGLKEALERHALMSWFYNCKKFYSKKVEISEYLLDDESKIIYQEFKKKDFNFNTYVIKTYNVYTIFIIVKNGKNVCMGSACGQIKDAIRKALDEIVVTYVFSNTLKSIQPKKLKDIKNLPQHCLYYNSNKVNSLINYLDSISNDNFKINNNLQHHPTLLREIKKAGYRVFYKDITAPDVRAVDLTAIKVIIPGFLDIIKNASLIWNNHGELKNIKIPRLPTPFA